MLRRCLSRRAIPPTTPETSDVPLLIDIFPARADNYGYLVHDVATGKTASIDAPDAKAIREALTRRGWTLSDIYITQHGKRCGNSTCGWIG